MRDQDEESLGPGRLDACYGRPYRPNVVGIVGLAIGPHRLNDEGLIATCMGFFVMPDIRKSMLTIHGTSGYVGRIANRSRVIGVNLEVKI